MSRLLSIFFLLVFATVSIRAQSAIINEHEYRTKAAFIANFIRYTRWQQLPQQHFRFCTCNPKINDIFLSQLANESWFGLTPVFVYATEHNLKHCDLLFVDQASSSKWKSQRDIVRAVNLLVISESHGFANEYSHINFFFADDKLRFEINPQRVHTSQLSINASLLRLARIISAKEQHRD